jgi:nitroreductase
MDTFRAATTRRTIRLFQPKEIGASLMERILEAGRLAPSASNRQMLEFVVVQDPANREKLFEHLAWAGYVRPKRTPPEGARPTAYVIVLVQDKELTTLDAADAGAAMENMILAAWNEGVGSCWIWSVDRDKVKPLFDIPDDYHIFSVLAMGYPAEQPVTEVLTESNHYWLDENNILHVPKRRLSQILHYETFKPKHVAR